MAATPEQKRAWYLRNKEAHAAMNKKWRTENHERKRELERAWCKNNRDKMAAKAAKRRAEKLQATPSWANKEAVSFAYFAARTIHKFYGGSVPHVDHDIPLVNKHVCGLHVHENLVLKSAQDNLKKSNKFTI